MAFISLAQSALIINNTQILGWSDDSDALTFPEIVVSNIKTGATGQVSATATGIRGGTVGIKLMPETPSQVFLNTLAAAQRAGGSVVINGKFTSFSTNATVTLNIGTFTNYKVFSDLGAGEKSSIAFEIYFQEINTSFEGANFNEI